MYRFVAKSMLIFVVTLPSGLIKNIEFERCSNDAYSYITDNKQVAECIRQHPLTKAGRIIDESQPEEVQIQQQKEEQVKDENALHFDPCYQTLKRADLTASPFKILSKIQIGMT